MATRSAPKKITSKAAPAKATTTKAAAPAKAATKTQAKPAAKTASKSAKTEKIPDNRGMSIDDIMSSVNKELGLNVVRRAETMETLYLLRRPTGITSLDIELGGGFPASATTVLVGPDGAGKDYLLWLTAAQLQKIYGDDFCMCVFFTEFKADKPFMRDFCGLKIAFSPEELDAYDEARTQIGLPLLTEEEREERRTQIGEILIIDGVTAEKGFDAIIRLVASNKCQMCVINSIGSLQTEAKESLDSFEDFARQSSEATLLSSFIPKLAMTLNDDRNGRNETSLFIVNQMRSKRDAQPIRGRPATDKDKYEPGSKSWALKHGKAIELAIHKGAKIIDEVEKTVAGRLVKWDITKGKLGTHDGKSGEYEFFYDAGANVAGDLFNTIHKLGIIPTNVGWIEYEHPEFGFRLNGSAKVKHELRTNTALFEHLRLEAFKVAGLIYRFK
jgi:RecA/RadA recombinase